MALTKSAITGSASNVEKFLKAGGNRSLCDWDPLYHWTHMELKTFFGIEEALSPKTDKSHI